MKNHQRWRSNRLVSEESPLMVPGMALPASMLLVLQVHPPRFTKHSYLTFCHLVAGKVAQTGRRTVTGMLTGAGLSQLPEDTARLVDLWRTTTGSPWYGAPLALALVRCRCARW